MQDLPSLQLVDSISDPIVKYIHNGIMMEMEVWLEVHMIVFLL